jgi:hypothetical protein
MSDGRRSHAIVVRNRLPLVTGGARSIDCAVAEAFASVQTTTVDGSAIARFEAEDVAMFLAQPWAWTSQVLRSAWLGDVEYL